MNFAKSHFFFWPFFHLLVYSNIKKINEKYFSLLKNFEKNFFYQY